MAAYAALVSLKHIIENLELHPRPPISLHKEHVRLLTAKISFLQEFLRGYNPHLSYQAEADPLESRIADAVYAAEDAIESRIVDRILDQEPVCDLAVKMDNNITNEGESSKKQRKKYWGKRKSNVLEGASAPKGPRADPPQIPSWRPEGTNMYEAVEKVIEGLALVEKESMGIKQIATQLHTMSPTPPDSSTSSFSSSIVQQKKMMMVGADDVLLEMKSMLLSESNDLQVIPIVGMGGSGKTTLALNIYQDGLVRSHFDICAWATVSQEYSVKQIFMRVLGQLNQRVDQDLSEGQLGEMLYKYLFSRRYVFILDDIWSIEVWGGVERFLPDNKDGSKIIITTRLSNLASRLSSSKSLEMKLLDEANSWDLLSKTVFGEKDCPPELEEIGKRISQSCKGLPLSIVVVGGLLAKSEHTREFWEYVEGNLNSVVNSEDDERFLKILYMSYKQLPVHLKPCFLYMGVFHEDHMIRISQLIRIWVAEGFLEVANGKSLEEIGRACLKSLIDRNLVLIDQKGSTGNIKYCRMHDLLRDMCLREAEKERFYAFPTTPPTPQGIASAAQRRIAIPNVISKNEAAEVLSSTPLARSLIWFHDNPIPPPLGSSSRLLRVLHASEPFLEGMKGSSEFIKSVNQLVNARMLVLWYQPPNYSIFWNLQTLYIHDGLISIAPTVIWHMPYIRHLCFIMGLNLPDPPSIQDDDIVVWKNLQTLKSIVNFRCNERMVEIIRNVRKLAIVFNEGIFDGDKYNLTNLNRLDKLESLSCYFYVFFGPSGPENSLPNLINFPHFLKKLTLFIIPQFKEMLHFQCLEEILEKVGLLPHLEKLRLLGTAFKESEWITTQCRFPRLKYLHLGRCGGLEVWTTESSHFPCLEHLRIDYMHGMEIPLELAEIPALRLIELTFCGGSVLISAKMILEEQEEFYGEEETSLQVQVAQHEENREHDSLASRNFRFTYFKEY